MAKRDFLYHRSVAMTKREILDVAEGWLSKLICCWEAAVHP